MKGRTFQPTALEDVEDGQSQEEELPPQPARTRSNLQIDASIGFSTDRPDAGEGTIEQEIEALFSTEGIFKGEKQPPISPEKSPYKRSRPHGATRKSRSLEIFEM